MAVQQIETPSASDEELVTLDGKKLRQLRKQAKLSQRELAKRVELSDGYISQIENNLRPISTDAAERISHFFGLALSQLCGQDIAPSPTARSTFGLGDEGISLLLDGVQSVIRTELSNFFPTRRPARDEQDLISEEFSRSLDRFKEQRESATNYGTVIEFPQSTPIDRLATLVALPFAAGRKALAQHDYKEAEEQLERAYRSLIGHCKLGGEDRGYEAELLRLRSGVGLPLVSTNFHRGDLRRALSLATEGEEAIRNFPELLPERVDFLIWLAELYDALGQAGNAMGQIRNAKAVLRNRSWPSGATRDKRRAHLYRVEGSVFLRQGRWRNAERCFAESLKKAKSLSRADELWNKAFVKREMTRLALRRGGENLSKAILFCHASYDIRLSLGYGDRAEAVYAVHMADVLRYRSEDREALYQLLSEAWFKSRRIGDQIGMARAQLRLARNCRKRELPLEAATWATMTLDDAERLHLPLLKAEAHRQRGLASQTAALLLERELPLAENDTERNQISREIVDYLEQAEQDLRKSYELLSDDTILDDVFELAVAKRVLAIILALRTGTDPDRVHEAQQLIAEAWRDFTAWGAEDEKWRIAEMVNSHPMVRSILGQHLDTAIAETGQAA